MEQSFAVLLPLMPSAQGGHSVFFKHFGVNVNNSAVPPAAHSSHAPPALSLPAGKPQNCSGVPSPSICRVFRRNPHLLPPREHQARASSTRGRKNRLRRRRQLNQADPFRPDAAGRKGLLCGERGCRARPPPAPGPRRRLWRQRQQLGRPRAPAPAKGASVALNAPFHHSSREERG